MPYRVLPLGSKVLALVMLGVRIACTLAMSASRSGNVTQRAPGLRRHVQIVLAAKDNNDSNDPASEEDAQARMQQIL